jgi:hypothetical protein
LSNKALPIAIGIGSYYLLDQKSGQRFQADRILNPHLLKALFVVAISKGEK